MKYCEECEQPLDRRNTSGRCRSCNGKRTMPANAYYGPRLPTGIPLDLVPLYRRLCRSKGVRAADARRMVLEGR